MMKNWCLLIIMTDNCVYSVRHDDTVDLQGRKENPANVWDRTGSPLLSAQDCAEKGVDDAFTRPR